MNKILGFAAFGLLISMPAHAQRSMSGTLGPNGGSIVGGTTGGIGGPASSGGGTVIFHTLTAVPSTQFLLIDVSGLDGQFVPSSWIQFEKGLAEGHAVLAAQRKSLAEVAAENRLTERPKAKLIITQDARGNAVILRR
jgi:hypothetical protein